MVADLDHATAQDDTDEPRRTLGYRRALLLDRLARVGANDRLLGLDRHGTATLPPFFFEYQRLREVRAKFAKMAIDAGVEGWRSPTWCSITMGWRRTSARRFRPTDPLQERAYQLVICIGVDREPLALWLATCVAHPDPRLDRVHRLLLLPRHTEK